MKILMLVICFLLCDKCWPQSGLNSKQVISVHLFNQDRSSRGAHLLLTNESEYTQFFWAEFTDTCTQYPASIGSDTAWSTEALVSFSATIRANSWLVLDIPTNCNKSLIGEKNRPQQAYIARSIDMFEETKVLVEANVHDSSYDPRFIQHPTRASLNRKTGINGYFKLYVLRGLDSEYAALLPDILVADCSDEDKLSHVVEFRSTEQAVETPYVIYESPDRLEGLISCRFRDAGVHLLDDIFVNTSYEMKGI